MGGKQVGVGEFNGESMYTSAGYDESTMLFFIEDDWLVEYDWGKNIRPIVSLKSGLKITGGNGTEANPYKIGL